MEGHGSFLPVALQRALFPALVVSINRRLQCNNIREITLDCFRIAAIFASEGEALRKGSANH